MNTAILGWGSLLWDRVPQFDEQHGDWELDGPRLKLEFSRISCSRLGALTLVIDSENGSETVVAWCKSRRRTIQDAACDLRCREGTTMSNIETLVVAQCDNSEHEVRRAIRDWPRLAEFDAVVWTALSSNFKEIRREPFSIEAAIRYVQSLSADGKVKAAEYVWRAPDFVATRLRTQLQAQPWFVRPGG